MGGCVVSSQFKPDSTLPGHDEYSMLIYQTLHLSLTDIGMLWKQFVSIKSTGMGIYIDVNELVGFLGHHANNEFCLKVFRRFSISRCDKLDLCEFIATFWVFLTLPISNLPAFCFMNCDKRVSRCLERYVVSRMVKLLHDIINVHDEDTEGNKFLNAMEDEGVLNLTLGQFTDYAVRRPLLCEPLFELVCGLSLFNDFI